LKVIVTRQAKADVAAAAEHYERAREGLGAEFLDRVEDGIDKIAANPLAYRRVFGEIRRCNLEQFPFALWYRLSGKAVGSLVFMRKDHPGW
jgi:plasmid stabilization system protein ParE